MPIDVGAKPTVTTTPGGTQDVNIVNWDSSASIPAGTANIGKVIVTAITGTSNVAVVNTPTVTAVALSGSVSVINTVAISGTASASIINTADIYSLPTGGFLRYLGTGTNVGYGQLLITSSAAAILVTSVSGKSIVVLSLFVNGNTANSLFFQSATTNIAGPLFIATSGVGMVLGRNEDGWFKTNAGQSLVGSLAASATAGGSITYVVV